LKFKLNSAVDSIDRLAQTVDRFLKARPYGSN